MARSTRSSTSTQAPPPPEDALRCDLDRLAARIVARCLSEYHGVDPIPVEVQIDALKTAGGYWSTTRRGAPAETITESAYTKYRQGMNGGASVQTN